MLSLTSKYNASGAWCRGLAAKVLALNVPDTIWVLVLILESPLPIQLPACGLDSPKRWDSASVWETRKRFLVPGYKWAHHRSLRSLGEWIIGQKIFLLKIICTYFGDSTVITAHIKYLKFLGSNFNSNIFLAPRLFASDLGSLFFNFLTDEMSELEQKLSFFLKLHGKNIMWTQWYS